MDEFKKDFHSQRLCYFLNGKTFFQVHKAVEYLMWDLKRSEQFAFGYLELLRDEYYRNQEMKQ